MKQSDGNIDLPWTYVVRGEYIDQMDRRQFFRLRLCCSFDQLKQETERVLSVGRRKWKRGLVPGSEFKSWTEDMFEYQTNPKRLSNTLTDITTNSTGAFNESG